MMQEDLDGSGGATKRKRPRKKETAPRKCTACGRGLKECNLQPCQKKLEGKARRASAGGGAEPSGAKKRRRSSGANSAKCCLCDTLISADPQAINDHLQACLSTSPNYQNGDQGTEFFILRADSGPYYLYFKVPKHETLAAIDRFLRDVWLECCGHLSTFELPDDPDSYYNMPALQQKGQSDVYLSDRLVVGQVLIYSYDMGSTTTVLVNVVSEGVGDGQVQLLVRNVPIPGMQFNSPREGVCGYDGPPTQ